MTRVLRGGQRETCTIPSLPVLELPVRLDSSPLFCGAGRAMSRERGNQH